MANTDLTGFSFARNMYGGNQPTEIRSLGVQDGADIYRGDPLDVASGLAGPAATNASMLGVAIGFGRVAGNDGFHRPEGASLMFDPSNLTHYFYDDSASTHTDWVVFYIPAEGNLFSVQAQTGSSATLAVGGTADIVAAGTGDATSGQSLCELQVDTVTNNDVMVVDIPKATDNDTDGAHKTYIVAFTDTVIAQA